MNWNTLPHTRPEIRDALYLIGASLANPPPSLAGRDPHFVLMAQSRHLYTICFLPLFFVGAIRSILCPIWSHTHQVQLQITYFGDEANLNTEQESARDPGSDVMILGSRSKSLKETLELLLASPLIVWSESSLYFLHPPPSNSPHSSIHEQAHSAQMEGASSPNVHCLLQGTLGTEVVNKKAERRRWSMQVEDNPTAVEGYQIVHLLQCIRSQEQAPKGAS